MNVFEYFRREGRKEGKKEGKKEGLYFVICKLMKQMNNKAEVAELLGLSHRKIDNLLKEFGEKESA